MVKNIIHIGDDCVLFNSKYNSDAALYKKQKSGKGCQKEAGLDSHPTMIGVFILAYSRFLMNEVVQCINGFKESIIYYRDTDSLYIKRKYIKLLQDAGYYGKNLGQGKNDMTKPKDISCKKAMQNPELYA